MRGLLLFIFDFFKLIIYNLSMKNNPFPYSHTNKRYHTYDHYLKGKFGGKVFKVSLDGGFTCPNRDGTKGVGGCTFCSSHGSGDFTESANLSISEQFSLVRDRMHLKWPNAEYIAYFQAYTNTYAPIDKIKLLYEEALAQPGTVGLSVSTRPDCLTPEIIEYLRDLNDRTFLTVELGLQSIHDETSKRINRCHTYEEFLDGYHALEGIPRCIHIINGLPGEDHNMMMETAHAVADLKPDFLKIHLLHVLKNTVMADEYRNKRFDAMPLEDYVKIVCDQIEIIPAETVIERVTGDGAKDDLIAPLWSLKKFVVMNEIDKELSRRDSYQGIKLK